jgi:ribosomal protein S18 acetylase RimI-like enzyme
MISYRTTQFKVALAIAVLMVTGSGVIGLLMPLRQSWPIWAVVVINASLALAFLIRKRYRARARKPRICELFDPQRVQVKDGRTVTIRPLSTKDGKLLGDFYTSIPREDQFFYDPHPLTRGAARRLAARADSRLVVQILAQAEDGSVGGYCFNGFDAPDSPVSRMGICVRRDFQGQGLGGALLDYLLRITERIGPPVMSLTVKKANSAATALYLRRGFRIVHEGTSHRDGEPQYYMERKVR